MPIKDPEKRREYHRKYVNKRYQEDEQYRNRHKQLVRQNKKKLKVKVKEIVSEWKSGGCSICEEKDLCCLVAHHLDPKNKKFNISQTWQDGRSVPSLIKELAKCICLCHNCHYKVHAGKIKLAQ